MAKASDNVFPKIIAGVQTSDPAAPVDGSWKWYAKPGGLYARSSNSIVGPFGSSGVSLSSATPLVESGAGSAGSGTLASKDDHVHPAASSSGLLAVTSYAPGSDTTVATITATSGTDCDATNLKVTFTAPASGNVLVRLSALCTPDNNSPYTHAAYWGLREATTNIAGPFYLAGINAQLSSRYSAAFYLSGISAGSHTYKWSAMVASSGQMTLLAGTTWGACVMEVWAAP